MPNPVGSKPNLDNPLGRFIPLPNSTFLNKEAQKRFDHMRSEQEMSPNTLVRRGVEKCTSPRLQIVTESQKVQLVNKIAHTAMKSMGQTAALQACLMKASKRITSWLD